MLGSKFFASVHESESGDTSSLSIWAVRSTTQSLQPSLDTVSFA